MLAGSAAPECELDERALGEGVVRLDYLDEDVLWQLLADSDVCVSLRWPTMGETSGMAIRALSLGKPLVVSDVGWFSELPDCGRGQGSGRRAGGGDAGRGSGAAAGDDGLRSGWARPRSSMRGASTTSSTSPTSTSRARGGGGRHGRAGRRAQGGRAGGPRGRSRPNDPELAEVAARAPRGRPWQLSPPRRARASSAPRVSRRVVRAARSRSPLVLGGAVLLAIAVRVVLAPRIETPWIMVDELIYSELAKSFAERGEFLIRDSPSPAQQPRLPGADRARMAGRVGGDGLRPGEGDQRGRDGACGRPRLSSGAAAHVAGLALLAAGPRAADAVARLHGHADDRERVLPGLRRRGCFAIALALERPTLLRRRSRWRRSASPAPCAPRASSSLAIFVVGARPQARVRPARARRPEGIRYVSAELRRYLPSAAAVLPARRSATSPTRLRRALGLESGLGAYGGV